jgi:Fe-S cluster biogenesis protein NfuA
MTVLNNNNDNIKQLVGEISRFEAIISEWDESQRCVATGLKRAIESLHKVALMRLIQSLKQDSISALRHAVEDEVVYGLLLYHELVKPLQQKSLNERLESALLAVRPGLKEHDGDIELVALKLPDTVEIKLLGTCKSCAISHHTLSNSIEATIKEYCPEIKQVISVK